MSNKKLKILMVCLGNICRSPIAQGIMEKMIKEKKLDWQVDSAALENYNIGDSPHPLSIKICLANNIDIRGQKARLFTYLDLEKFDLIYIMEENLLHSIKSKFQHQNNLNNVKLFMSESSTPLENVPDPYYGTYENFIEVFHQIYRGCSSIVSKYSPYGN